MFPTEILLTIFKIVYMQNREEVMDEREFYFSSSSLVPEIVGKYKCIWRRDEELRYPCLFPYNIASVCAKWRATAASVPAFWTRVVFFLDSGPEGSSLVDLQHQLQWSRDLPLEITLGRMNLGDNFMYDMGEAARVRSAMELLLPHISRWHMFYISTIRSSSLPVILKELRGTSPILKILRLECEGDDADDDLNVYGRDVFICPALHNFDIDGANFLRLRNAYGGEWVTQLVPQLEYLSVSVLSPAEEEEGNGGEGETDGERVSGAEEKEGINRPEKGRLNLDMFLGEVAKLTSLRQLILKSIIFNDILLLGIHEIHHFSPTLDTLVLEDLSVSALLSILFDCNYPGLTTLKLARCPLDAMPEGFLPDIPCLVLQDLAPTVNVMEIVDRWHGMGLEIVGCPTFDDTVLKRLSVPGVGVSIEELAIIDCTNFSVSVLQKMVESRLPWAWPMQILKVTGEGPAMTDDERAWFGNHVAEFSYEVVLADPERLT
ncbi:hypothetical protein K443DRAFT_684133 [Laccaria amethystina LaAM-08-1]|jgi:hypothetical protein|uniref:F-box domain-containing protein n=1 Tax=Laccaria amethystina LaAM-08-1 TaxID=1095629 RepID=A0A0C9WJ24_9AGAR|nr:hypothetical protein K443DRAFT_684133 [Laccaria amethystina LaAM-08-1]